MDYKKILHPDQKNLAHYGTKNFEKSGDVLRMNKKILNFRTEEILGEARIVKRCFIRQQWRSHGRLYRFWNSC